MDEHLAIAAAPDAQAAPPPPLEARGSAIAVRPQCGGGGCGCGGGGGSDCACKQKPAAPEIPPPPRFVLAIGTLHYDFPSPGLRAEFGSATALVTKTAPENYLAWDILSQGSSLNVARSLCWTLQISGPARSAGVDAYILVPRTYVELNQMIATLQPTGFIGDRVLTAVTGTVGPVAPPHFCNGLQLPVVSVEHISSFRFTDFATNIASQAEIKVEVAASIFGQFLQVTDNAGELDEHRAINYLALRYLDVYRHTARLLDDGWELTSVSAQPARVQGVRRIIEVVFQYTSRDGGGAGRPLRARETMYRYCKVDVTEQYPFLVSDWAPFYPTV
jgi:hypothetical protein